MHEKQVPLLGRAGSHRFANGARRWGGGPLYATRRTKTVRRKKPGRSTRNDGGVVTLYVAAEAATS